MARSKMSVYVKPGIPPVSHAPVVVPKKVEAPLPDIIVADMKDNPVASAKTKKGKKMAAAAEVLTAPAPISPISPSLAEEVSMAGPKPPAPEPDEPVPDSTAQVQMKLEANSPNSLKASGPDSPEAPTPLLPGPEIDLEKDLSASSSQEPTKEAESKPDNGEQTLVAAPMASSSLEPLRVLEAALFMSSMSMPAADLGKLVGIGAVGHVSNLLSDLSKQYEQSGSSLEVVEENAGKWVMRIRAPFAPSVRRFAGEAEIPKHSLRTLAYISRHEGITKRDLFRRLGGSIYEDVGNLVEKGFLDAKPVGRTQSLHTTNKFRQYFQG